MKAFSTITPERMTKLALASGHRISHTDGDASTVSEETLAGYFRFGQAVYNELKDGTKIESIDLDRFTELANEHAGFQPYDVTAHGAGSIDPAKFLSSASRQLFFTRLAYRISTALNAGQEVVLH